MGPESALLCQPVCGFLFVWLCALGSHCLKMVDNKLKITWQEPQGTDYRIYLYKASGDSPLSLIKSIKPNTLEFVDSQITGDNNYQYGIKVMYDSGSTSQMIKSEAVTF